MTPKLKPVNTYQGDDIKQWNKLLVVGDIGLFQDDTIRLLLHNINDIGTDTTSNSIVTHKLGKLNNYLLTIGGHCWAGKVQHRPTNKN